MTEVEKEESQKTVVSFITGLLIGGLLVWIFSSTPEEKKQPEEVKTTTEQVQTTTGGTKTEISNTTTKGEEKVATTNQKIEVGKGSINAADQGAGQSVTLGDLTLPAASGWVVVRDDINGVPGNVLGAARFNADEQLAPKTIELIRKTEAGKSYRIMFYTQEGSLGFALGEDKPIEGASATFKAQ